MEIHLSAINTLPLITQLFPHIKVFFDDDADIPVLSKREGDIHHIKCIQGETPVPETIQEFVKPKPLNSQVTTPNTRFAWLVCCSSVFLLDMEKKSVWASPDQSLMPLMAIILFHDKFDNHESRQMLKPSKSASAMDLSTAYGHVTLL